jgi:pimeloyl-ACP methyl ester carboxylesterase
MRVAARCLIAMLFAHLTCGAPANGGETTPAPALVPCKFADTLVSCGTLAVPEDRNEPGGRRISLNIVVVPATGDPTLPPLYSLDGGPGIAATDSISFWATAGSIHRRSRDIVLVDQRGTGRSAPLGCKVNFYDPLESVLEPAAVRRCRERLSATADLSAYSTATAVEDVEAVRAALRHDRIDLIGLSYGTRVAQEYLRAHRDRVRAVVLLGTLSPKEKLPLFSIGAQAVLDRLIGECTGDPVCHQAIPDPAADIAMLRRKFGAGRVTAAFQGRPVAIESGPFWEAVRGQLMTTVSQRRVPWLLHQAAHGNFEPFLTATAGKPDDGWNGLLLSVSCPEDTLRISSSELVPLTRTVFGVYRVKRQIAACTAWGVAARGRLRSEFVDSDAPVLLMAGDMDAVTPVQWGRDVAAHLPHSRLVVIPELGHFPDGLSHMECYDQIIARFFESPGVGGLDLSCVETMHPPQFQTGLEGG